ncbi:hypothetical protein [Nannocystis punicea]|uniref:Uncharacterized protein n=1 Tax=Nannocystis punicea TaxID=2995304 RepID=A0ABY7HBM1_9BACT|nr:hypothetical protein [Nannocystis poenicansa]WAS96671.1 hypothetical protein O0S08_11015 [Nannocystis poenicansa]
MDTKLEALLIEEARGEAMAELKTAQWIVWGWECSLEEERDSRRDEEQLGSLLRGLEAARLHLEILLAETCYKRRT